MGSFRKGQDIARKRYTPEQIIGKLRAIEVHLHFGMTAEQAARREEISIQSYFRWTLPGVPGHLRSHNGSSEFTARAVRRWLKQVDVKTRYITPGSPWENGYIESFNGKLANELLEREVFDTLHEAKVLIERWRVQCNTVRPHSSLGYRPSAPEAWLVEEPGSAALHPALHPKGITPGPT